MLWTFLYIIGAGISCGIFAYHSGMDDPVFIIAGMFWPISIPALVAYKTTIKIAKISEEKQEFRREQKRLAAIENNLREQEIRKALKELNNSL